MNYMWNITIDDYIKVIELSQELGIKPGESMEAVFLAYMKAKGQKPAGASELNKEELLKEMTSKDQKILDIKTDKDGKQTFRTIKKKKEQ